MTSFDEELAFLEDSTSHAIEKDETGLLQHQLVTSPLLTFSVLQDRAADFPSRALLGLNAGERIYFNTNAPNSAVICGVQGSGKSHTVSCLLEGGLIADARIGQLPSPLSALVFHFDTQDLGRPCEAAFLSVPSAHSVNPTILPRITVLCSPSNVNRRRRAYSSLPHVRVYPLQLSERDLTADRMLAIMGCSNLETAPLYLHTILRIVREIGAHRFSYLEFKRRLAAEPLDFRQRSMLKLRLDLLDCFMRPGAPQIQADFRVGGLVLVDLTDPFLDGLTAAVLFDSVLGSFIQWQTPCGKLVVLDEAHKYLVNSDTDRLAHSISDIIRLQRHLATRVIIATQEPTVIPPTILDLASTIICHRFSSPAWCAHLSKHVSLGKESAHWFEEVMQLPTGHAIVFSPSALMKFSEEPGQGATLLGRGYIKVRVRPRLTLDGGASHLAVQSKFGAHPYPTEQEERVADRPMTPVPERPVIPVSDRPVSPLEVPSVSLQTSTPEARALASSTPPPESTPIGADISMSSPSTSLEPSSPQENLAPRKYAPLFGPSTSQEPSRPQENPARSTYAPLFGPAPSTSREPPWLQENPARSTSVSLFGPAPREPPGPQEKHTPSTYVSLFGPAPSTSREPPWLQEKQTPSTSVSLFRPVPSEFQEPRLRENYAPSTHFGAGFAPSTSFHPRATPTASEVNDVPRRSTPLCDWAVDTVPSVVPPHEYPASATPAFFPTPSETSSSLYTADPTRRSGPRTILTRSMYAAARAGPQGPPVSEGSSTSTSSYQPSFSFYAPPASLPPPAFSHVNLGAVTVESRVWRVASRFRHLVNYLIRHRADWEPVKLHRAKSSISAVVRTEYPGVAKKKCWDKMLQEAVDAQLVQLINMDIGKKNPEGKLVRLIARGEFIFVLSLSLSLGTRISMTTEASSDKQSSLRELIKLVNFALQTPFTGVERELSFEITHDVPFSELVDKIAVVQKEKRSLIFTIMGSILRIRQRIPSEPHETAADLISKIETELLLLAGVGVNDTEIQSTRSSLYTDPSANQAKEPDGGLRPMSRLTGTLPSVVIEVGDTQTRPSLHADVDDWFRMNSNGPERVQLVIVVKIFKSSNSRIEVEFYERAAQPPLVATQVNGLGPFSFTANDLILPNTTIPAIHIPMHYFYDTIPTFLTNHPAVMLSSTVVQRWLARVFHTL